MAESDWNPDTGGRSLAEILREAGIESAARANRRRRPDDSDDSGIRQRGSGPPAPEGREGYGRRRSDLATTDAPVRERRAAPRESNTAAIPGLRPERKPGVPPTAASPAPPRERRAPEPERRAPEAERRVPERPRMSDTGPIPVVRAEDLEDEVTPRESALAWLRFAGELVIALAAGVGVYFAATVLWEQLPQLAVVLAPLAVTGLVAGVGVWRQRMGREPMGLKLLAVLVFAGTLLTIAPAAGLLSGS